jgi:hypothetical protein
MDSMKSILFVVVGLLVGAAGGYWYGMLKVDEVNQQLTAMTQQKTLAQQNADRLTMANQVAIKKWSTELGKLVMVSVPADVQATSPAVPDPAKMVDSARALLAARDGIRVSLDSARAAMDSDFDALATELGNPKMAPAKVEQILQVLQQTWPDKQKNLDAATRALLVELGILPPEKPVATMAPTAAPAAAPAASAAPDAKE